jgi:hypothetical protein
MIHLLAVAVLVLAPTSWAQARPPILEQIAKTYGLDSLGQVEAIRYTLNLQFPGPNLSRSWEWEPNTSNVSYHGKDKNGKPINVTYMRSELSSQSDAVKNDIDPGFISDNYLLVFPFHAYWDTSATTTDEGMKKLPVGTGSATLLVVKYPNEGVKRPATPGSSTSAKTTASSTLSSTTGTPSRGSSSQHGQATKRQDPCCSPRSTVAQSTASPCTNSSLTYQSSRKARIPG